MKAYWCFIISLFILASQGKAYSQNLYSPYPIIFVHGLNSNDSIWSVLIDSMKINYGMIFGGRMDFCLNQDGNTATSKIPEDYKDYTNELHQLTKGDLYTINFDVNNFGIPYNNLIESNQSGIVKQGLAVRDAIKHVLEITGKDKVILVGHSMGGLALREYLQNRNLWYDPYINHHVAKLCTIGTPHGGSNATDFGTHLSGLFGVDLLSEAVRDLRTSYSFSYFFPFLAPNPLIDAPGAYLFGGVEDLSYMRDQLLGNFCNADVNCDGTEESQGVAGLNKKAISNNLSYSCIVGNGDILGADSNPTVIGDGVVSSYSANLNNFCSTNATIFELTKNSGVKSLWHNELPKQIEAIMGALDEPNVPALAYEIKKDSTIKGTITYQKDNFNLDIDLYKIIIDKSGYITIKIDGNPLSGVGQIALLDNNQNCLTFKATKTMPDSFTYNLLSGTYYIRVRGLATNVSYKYPYILSTKLDDKQINTSTKSITRLEYFIDTDPGFGNGLTLNVSTPNDIDGTFNIPLNNISEGFHMLYIRTKDNAGNWSITSNSTFYKTNVSFPDIVKMEYFLDTDPGFDKATSVPITNNTDINKSINIDLSNVSNGFHILFIRTKNAIGKWSVTSNTAFYRMPSHLKNIIDIEYFFDMDPGYGQGTVIPITPMSSDITKQFNVDLACLSTGSHTFYVRVKDELGNWSLIYSNNIIVISVAPIITKNGNILQSNAPIGNQWYNQNGLINGATNQDYVVTTNGDYYVIVTHSGCSSDKSNIIKAIVSGVEQTVLENLIKIYPNPTTESFQVSGFTGKVLLILTNINGICILAKQVTDKESISINNLPEGVYIVKFITNEGTVERKLIKK